MLEQDGERQRVILIGASNLTFSFPLVVNSISQSLPGPLEIFAVHGHGRSFCQWSYVLHRGLPSVLDCGLWQALAQQPPVSRTWSLISDVGNDLIYGVEVDVLLQRLTETFRRLQTFTHGLTYVRLPVERVMMLSSFSYRTIKKMLFPGPTVPWRIMSKRVVEFDEQATLLARQYGATVVTPPVRWYGVDPIHIRQSQRGDAWREILQTWTFDSEPCIARPEFFWGLKLWRMPPAERTFWKRNAHALQPALVLPKGFPLWSF